eukprot:3499575-Amphidinium_carterae.1
MEGEGSGPQPEGGEEEEEEEEERDKKRRKKTTIELEVKQWVLDYAALKRKGLDGTSCSLRRAR